MRMRFWLAFLALPLCIGEEPTPRQLAAQLLDSVRDGAGAADPQFQPFLLWRAADVYIALDKVKARKLLEEAYEHASAMQPDQPLDPKSWLQVSIAASMADLDSSRAGEMLSRVFLHDVSEGSYDPRIATLTAILHDLLAKKQVDRAIDLVQTMGSNGPYPYSGVDAVISAPIRPTLALISVSFSRRTGERCREIRWNPRSEAS